jgi:hypothetical protein
VRGGAIAPICWAGLLAVLGVINWIWTGDAVQIGSFGFAVLAIVLLAAALAVAAPEARRRGAPGASSRPQALPAISLGAAIAGVGLAIFVFGFAFGQFPILFGAGAFIVGCGRLGLERRAQRHREREAARAAEPSEHQR